MIGTILGRVVGSHLLKAEWRKLDGSHLQATIEGLAWRGIVAGTVALYSSNDKFKGGLDQIIAAVTGG